MPKTLITFQNFKMSQSNKVLLENINISIHQFDRIVLVGQNGCGKSSLLSLLKNKDECDAGSIWIAPNLKIDYLEQDPPEPCINNLLEFLSKDNQHPNLSKIKKIIEELNLKEINLKNKLSGGEIRKIYIAKLILSESELLLLDEPTNHIDLPTIDWLEKKLLSLNKTLIIVSHDQEFLRKIATKTFWIHQAQILKREGLYNNFQNWTNEIMEVEKISSLGVNLKTLARDIIQHFLRHAVRDGYFHADMHQGNLLVDNSGQLIFIDFGIMGRIDKINRRFLAEILYGFIKRDYKKVAEVHIAAGLVPQNVNIEELAQALRSIGEPIFGQSVKDISGGRLLKQLFDITEKFNMQTQPQLLLLQKTMVVVEGVARKLDPNANIWEISQPVLEKWLKETKDPINELGNILKDTSEVIKKFPELPQVMDKANQALTFFVSGQIPQNSNTYSSLNEKKMELKSFKNQSIIGLLFLVILSIIVF